MVTCVNLSLLRKGKELLPPLKVLVVKLKLSHLLPNPTLIFLSALMRISDVRK